MYGEKSDAGRFDVDSHHAGDVGVIADKCDGLAKSVPVQDKPQESSQGQAPNRLHGYDSKKLADQELLNEITINTFERDGQPTGQEDGNPIPEELGSQGCHDGRYVDAGDNDAVDVAYERSGRQRQHDSD